MALTEDFKNDVLALRAAIADAPIDFIYWLEGAGYDYDMLTDILNVTKFDELKTPADKYFDILDVIEVYVGRYVESLLEYPNVPTTAPKPPSIQFTP